VSERHPPLRLPEAELGTLVTWGPVRWVVFPLAGFSLGELPSWNGNKFLQPPAPGLSVARVGPRSIPPWLGPREAELYQAFPYEARALEWLAGRRTAKALLSAVHELAAEEVEILPRPNDAPSVVVDGQIREDIRISLTHTRTYVAAAVSTQPVGIDVCDFAEGRKMPRIAYRVLNEGEAEDTGAVESELRGAAVWALKEAGLKLDCGGIFQPGAKSIWVKSLEPIRLATGELSCEAWGLPHAVVALARRSASTD
jgi:phosphopantetheinyl transferase